MCVHTRVHDWTTEPEPIRVIVRVCVRAGVCVYVRACVCVCVLCAVVLVCADVSARTHIYV